MTQKRRMMAAQQAVLRAIRGGVLFRPEMCSRCGAIPGLGRRGRPRIHAHHHKGYEKLYQLDVQWVCSQCHGKMDARLNGENHPGAKLTQEQANYIRKTYKRHSFGRDGAAFLAKQFGIHRRTVLKIARQENWIEKSDRVFIPWDRRIAQ